MFSVDIRDVLGWLPKSVHTLKIRGFHLLRRVNLEPEGGRDHPTYPHLRNLEVVFCGSSDRDLLHVCCLCPGLEYMTVVVSMTSAGGAAPPGQPPQPPQHGMVASHLHAVCHNPALVQCIVLVKVGEGWIQVKLTKLGQTNEECWDKKKCCIDFSLNSLLFSGRLMIAKCWGSWCCPRHLNTSGR